MNDFFVKIFILLILLKWIFHYIIICKDEGEVPTIFDFGQRLFYRTFPTQFYFPFYFSNEFEYIDKNVEKKLKLILWIFWLLFLGQMAYAYIIYTYKR
jgi:ABC-type anion transport system duplicated permease subunit